MAVVSQVPFTDGIAAISVIRWKDIFKAIIFGLRDLLRIITFREPFYIPIVAEPDVFAVMNKPGALEGVLSLVPDDREVPYYQQTVCPA